MDRKGRQNPKDRARHKDHKDPEQGGATKTKDSMPLPLQAVHGTPQWNVRGKVNWKKSRMDVVEGQPVLRVFYGKDSGTSGDPGVGGMAFSAVPTGLPAREAKIAFEAFFEDGWDWSKGGKIGGFFIGHGVASGYRHSDTCSSHRIMWQRDGGAISYIYPPASLKQADPALKDSGHGIAYFKDLFPAGTLKVGRWNSLVLGVRMNSFTPDGKPNADGVAYLEINGVAGVKRNIRWSRSPDLIITSFDFNTFFGGPDPAVKDCTALFRNFRMLPWRAPKNAEK